MTATSPMRVLLVGNSYTFFNDMPDMLAQLAQSSGKPLTTEMVVAGGYTLERHWRETRALEAVDAGAWDCVALQEQSLRPIQAPDRMREYVLRFATRIEAVGARAALYLTWARRSRPETQSGITKAYLNAAREAGAIVVPVGPAWEAALAAMPGLVLHKPDDSHPNPIGSYLGACVFLAVLTGANPVGLPHTLRISSERWAADEHVLRNLSSAHALDLQRIAWETAQHYAKELHS